MNEVENTLLRWFRSSEMLCAPSESNFSFSKVAEGPVNVKVWITKWERQLFACNYKKKNEIFAFGMIWWKSESRKKCKDLITALICCHQINKNLQVLEKYVQWSKGSNHPNLDKSNKIFSFFIRMYTSIKTVIKSHSPTFQTWKLFIVLRKNVSTAKLRVIIEMYVNEKSEWKPAKGKEKSSSFKYLLTNTRWHRIGSIKWKEQLKCGVKT